MAHRGEVVWTDVVGLADVKSGVEVTPEHQFQVGSITKTFTAVTVMRLREAGALALDDRLSDHLESYPHASATIRQLLAHASGLQRELPGASWETFEFPSSEELLGRLGDVEHVVGAHEHFHYSNLAFALLGEVVSVRTGRPYADYVEAEILAPLGLGRTAWSASDPVATGYFVEPWSDTVRPERPLDLGGADSAGGLWSTASDLCRWGAFLTDPDARVLSAEASAAMHTPQIVVDPDRWTSAWGLGLGLDRRGERIFAGHTGGMPGFLSGLAYARKERVSAAVLLNTESRIDPGSLAVDLAERAADAFPAEPEPWRPGEQVPEQLAGLLGPWWSEGTEFVFSWRGGRLEARSAEAGPENDPAVFEPDGDDAYRTVSGRERGEALRIVRAEDGSVTKLYWATYPFTRDPRPFTE